MDLFTILDFFRLSDFAQHISGQVDARKIRNTHRAVFKYSERVLENLTQQTLLATAELSALLTNRRLRQKGVE